MNLGSVLRKHRKELKLTMKEVAEKARISEGFLSQIENNVNTPSVDTLMNICGAMGVNAGDILNQVERQIKFVVIHKNDWATPTYPNRDSRRSVFSLRITAPSLIRQYS